MTDFNPADWKFSQFSGHPFMHIEPWVKATHIPTVVSAVSSSEQSQMLNRNKAVEMVQTKLKEMSDEIRL